MCIPHHEVSRVKQSQRAQAACSVQDIATLALHSITPSRCACAWYRAMLHSTNLQQTQPLEWEPKGTSSTSSTVGGASMLFTYTWYFLSPCSTQCSPKMGEDCWWCWESCTHWRWLSCYWNPLLLVQAWGYVPLDTESPCWDGKTHSIFGLGPWLLYKPDQSSLFYLDLEHPRTVCLKHANAWSLVAILHALTTHRCTAAGHPPTQKLWGGIW